MSGQEPVVRDWQKDCVYLIQFPRAGSVPSISPFCLKLETWLRIAQIEYQNVDNQFKFTSRKKQVPFVELNGRQVADTNFIVSELSRIFDVDIDEHLSERDMADFRAYQSLVEDSLFLHHNLSFLATEDGVIGHFEGFRKLIFRTYGIAKLKRSYKNKHRGHSASEVEMITKKNLKALSIFLGSKPWTRRSSVHMCMFFYAPCNKDIHMYLESECRNLVDYLRNVKDIYWPDWNECTAKLSLATRPNRTGGNTLSTVESLTAPKVLTPVPREPDPETHSDPRGDIEIFDVEEPTSRE
ncbi:hypothetical protein M3Y99_01766400 [Aphelenchoides fujianensis]|nr:hypothetical protein M3Y99_01766400 [Aphelenchoides fujianensis]